MATPVISNIDNTKHTYSADGVNYGLNPTTNRFEAVVPTKAPTGETKVSQPAVTPTTVVSGQTFADHVNNKIVPTMNQAQQTLADYQAQKKISTVNKTTKADGTSELYMSDGTRVRTDANGNVMPSTTPEQQIADTADAGMKFAYASDGTRTQIPLSDTATRYGMSDTNPTVAPVKPVLDTAELSSGTQVKKFNDNTYGLYDQSGKYIGNATESQYNNAKNSQSVLDKINLAINGNYPLKANQQAQIDAVKSIYSNLVKEQEIANANLTGGMTVAQNLYGMGNTAIAMGAIKTTVDQGIAKINDIQSKMASDVAKMTNAFQSENLEELKTAYTSFSANQKALQDNIDKIHDDTAAIEKEYRTTKTQVELSIDNDIRGLLDTAAKNGATPEQINKMNEALQNHDMAGAVNAGGETLLTASGVPGEYYAYARDAKSRNIQPMSFDEYQTKDANRKARIAAAGASVVAGTDMTSKQQAVFNSIVDKQNKSPLIMANDRAMILKKITEEVAKDPSNAALQVSFIYSMIQALDTYQSAVREGEINLIAGTQGLGEKIENLPSKIEQGNPLNPTKIKEYVAVSNTLTNSINNAANAKKNTFKAQASINGIGKQYNEWDSLVGEMNKTEVPTGQEHIQKAKQSKQVIDSYIDSNPEAAENVAKMYEKGWGDDKIEEFLRGTGKI